VNDREYGQTFAPADVGYIDFETRSATDIKSGAYRYATEADAIVLAFAIGDEAADSRAVYDFDGIPLRWTDMPAKIMNHHQRVMRGEAIWAAWNSGFDRAVWNFSTIGFPKLEAHHVIDVMAQAVASGLPPDLDMASRIIGRAKKDTAGKTLIPMFCIPGHKTAATPLTRPSDWSLFANAYATSDIDAMRAVFRATFQLSKAEWQEFWAMEAINERGACVDLKLVAAAAKLAEQDKVRSSVELDTVTNGKVGTVDQVAVMTAWLLNRLPPDGRKILQKREEEVDEFGAVKRPALNSLTRAQVQKLLVLMQAKYPAAADVIRVLELRLYGGSKTPAKFRKIEQSHVDGVLYGQYVFNGAAQTGRASSRGVQVHNLARDPLPYEQTALDAILDGAKYDEVAALGDGAPVARKLSLLIRPAFVPKGDNIFVWSDWSQIEARVLPWLCDHYAGAATRLQIFRDVDEDPSVPDLYTRTAAVLSHIPIEQVTKPIRQRGKVAELALGFMGGVGALQAMAAAYGMHISDEEAKEIVEKWRAANPWAVNYSKELWDKMRAACASPGAEFKAGRVTFCFHSKYLNGTLSCTLPSGRRLIYRALRWEWLDVLDDDDNVIDRKLELTYARSYGRQKIWPGIFVENVTQATAADFLRGTLVRLEAEEASWMPVRLHTHDEILVETTAGEAHEAVFMLGRTMRRGFDWSDGLPVMSEESTAFYYTKHPESIW
jgi:DNA polymerase bacteriophage-type